MAHPVFSAAVSRTPRTGSVEYVYVVVVCGLKDSLVMSCKMSKLYCRMLNCNVLYPHGLHSLLEFFINHILKRSHVQLRLSSIPTKLLSHYTLRFSDTCEGVKHKAKVIFGPDALVIYVNSYKHSILFVGHVQTVQTQIRRSRTLHLISVSTVCLQNFLSTYG